MKKEIKSKSKPVDVLDNSEPNESPDMREMDVPDPIFNPDENE